MAREVLWRFGGSLKGQTVGAEIAGENKSTGKQCILIYNRLAPSRQNKIKGGHSNLAQETLAACIVYNACPRLAAS